MIFSLDVRRARKGDCLLLHYGTDSEPGLVMIDGGPKGVYQPHLRPRLEEIREARSLAEDEPLPVDLLMISHVDDDHIQGILELTSELRDAANDKTPPVVRVQALWHNSFDNIIAHNAKELTASVEGQFGTASVDGSAEMSEEKKGEIEDESDEPSEVVASSLKVLASIAQGAQLREDAKRLGLHPNEGFKDDLIIANKGGKAFDMGAGLTFTVAGPMLPEVDALRKKHLEWLEKLKAEGKRPSDVLAAYVDKSVPNLSSLVLVAEVNGKKMLLTGDARGDKILEGLQLIGLLGPGNTSKIEVDLLKVPHHGSANNLDNDFFRRIIAKHYVFSGDGEHGNPEREALEMLLKERGDANYTIHLTYPIPDIDKKRKEDWEKEQTKEKNRKKNNPKTKKPVRDDWSPKKHSLTALFADHPKFGKKVKIVGAKKPHLIDLLDPIAF